MHTSGVRHSVFDAICYEEMPEFSRLIGMWHSAEFVLLLWQVESDTEPPDWLVSDQEEELIRLLSVENLHQSEPTTDIIQLLVA